METRMNNEKNCGEDVKHEIPEFTQDEVQAAIYKLKKGKQVTTTKSGQTTAHQKHGEENVFK